jgi:hypothetical protein
VNSELQVRLLDAVLRCLRPIARVLMGAGISYAQFEELSKRAFVEQSLGERDSRGRLTNVSRVAVRTGLSRKEVARLKTYLQSDQPITETVYRSGIPARVLQLWHSHSDYQSDGFPRDLTFDDGQSSFASLVRLVGGDVPGGAVRAELLAAGGIVELPNGLLRVCKRHFVPVDLGEDLVVGFAFIVGPLLESLEHNSINPGEAYIQRVAYSDNLPIAARANFKRLAHERAADLVQTADAWLTTNEESPLTMVTDGRRLGVGVFYFETDSPRTSVSQADRAGNG